MGILSKCVICDASIPVPADEAGRKTIYCEEHRETLTPKQRMSIQRMRNNASPDEIRAVARAMHKGAQLEPGLLVALEVIREARRSLAVARRAVGRHRVTPAEQAVEKLETRIERRIELARSFPTGLQE